jgi:hypothetical protein
LKEIPINLEAVDDKKGHVRNNAMSPQEIEVIIEDSFNQIDQIQEKQKENRPLTIIDQINNQLVKNSSTLALTKFGESEC